MCVFNVFLMYPPTKTEKRGINYRVRINASQVAGARGIVTEVVSDTAYSRSVSTCAY